MTLQMNGIQLNTTGLNMQTKLMDSGINNTPNPDNATTVSNNPMYNFMQVLFQGKQTDNIKGYNASDLFSHANNGLKEVPDKKGSTFTAIG